MPASQLVMTDLKAIEREVGIQMNFCFLIVEKSTEAWYSKEMWRRRGFTPPPRCMCQKAETEYWEQSKVRKIWVVQYLKQIKLIIFPFWSFLRIVILVCIEDVLSALSLCQLNKLPIHVILIKYRNHMFAWTLSSYISKVHVCAHLQLCHQLYLIYNKF